MQLVFCSESGLTDRQTKKTHFRWSRRDSDLSRVHDSAHSHSQRHGGHFGAIPFKESCIRDDGFLCQGLHPSPGNQARAGLVEGNVAIWTDTLQDRMLNFTASSIMTVKRN